MITFRFSNTFIAPAWNDQSIEKIEFILHETVDVGTRGSFYDRIGALRDVGQNHMLQMCALTMMENPGVFDAAHVRRARNEAISKVIFDPESFVCGQYKGYRNLPDVEDGSQAETFFEAHAHMDDDRWRQTQLVFSAGKALSHRKTQVIVTFREPVQCLCTNEEGQQKNRITFSFAPEENIIVSFFAKKHGLTNDIEDRQFVLGSHKEKVGDLSHLDASAYEKILYDAVRGDHILFASTDEVQSAWKVLDILFTHQEKDIIIYEKGVNGDTIKNL